jgi:hypothetical protein
VLFRSDAVILDFDIFKNAEVGPSRPELAEVFPEVLQRCFHPFFEILQDIFDHDSPPEFKMLWPVARGVRFVA